MMKRIFQHCGHVDNLKIVSFVLSGATIEINCMCCFELCGREKKVAICKLGRSTLRVVTYHFYFFQMNLLMCYRKYCCEYWEDEKANNCFGVCTVN